MCVCVSQSVEIYCFVFFLLLETLSVLETDQIPHSKQKLATSSIFFFSPFCQICLTNHRKRLQCCLVGLTFALKNSYTFYHNRVLLAKTYEQRFRYLFALFFYSLLHIGYEAGISNRKNEFARKFWQNREGEFRFHVEELKPWTFLDGCRRDSSYSCVSFAQILLSMSLRHQFHTTIRIGWCVCSQCESSEKWTPIRKINNNGCFVAVWRPRPIGSSEIGNVKKAFNYIKSLKPLFSCCRKLDWFDLWKTARWRDLTDERKERRMIANSQYWLHLPCAIWVFNKQTQSEPFFFSFSFFSGTN